MLTDTIITYSPEVQAQARQAIARISVARMRRRVLDSYKTNLRRRAAIIRKGQ